MFFYSSGGQKSNTGLTGLKSRHSRAGLHSGDSRGGSVFFPFPPSRDCPRPWFIVATSSIFKASNGCSGLSHITSLWPPVFWLPLLHYKNACDYVRPNQIIQDNLFILWWLIRNLNFPLPCNNIFTNSGDLDVDILCDRGAENMLFLLPQWLSLK